MPAAPESEIGTTAQLPGDSCIADRFRSQHCLSAKPRFFLSKADIYLLRLASMDLRLVLRVFGIKSEMDAPVKEKRLTALEMVGNKIAGDEDPDAVVDDLDLELSKRHSGPVARILSTQVAEVPGASSAAASAQTDGGFLALTNVQVERVGLAMGNNTAADVTHIETAIVRARGFQDASANSVGKALEVLRGSTAGVCGEDSGPSGRVPQSLSLSLASRPGRVAGVREPIAAANNGARLFHVLFGPAHKDAVWTANQPMSRANLYKGHVSLWTSVLGPLCVNATCRPEPSALIDGLI